MRNEFGSGSRTVVVDILSNVKGGEIRFARISIFSILNLCVPLSNISIEYRDTCRVDATCSPQHSMLDFERICASL